MAGTPDLHTEDPAFPDIAGVILLMLNEGGKITRINQEGCDILGYPEGELIGKNWYDLAIPVKNQETARKRFRGILAGGVELHEYHENPVLTKNGEERLISWHSAILRDKTGRAVGIISSGEDITERRQNELAVRQSEERYRSLFENALEGIFQITPEGHFLSVNPAYARLLGFESPEAMIAKVTDFGQQHYVRPEEREKFLRQMEKEGITGRTRIF